MGKKEVQVDTTIKLFDPKKDLKYMNITVAGDSPLILSKYTRKTLGGLTDTQEGKGDKKQKAKKNVNMYEEVIERIHWETPLPPVEEMVYNEETLSNLVNNNRPCILGVAFWKSVLATITRCGFDTYSTKARATFRVMTEKCPVTFSHFEIDGRIIPAKVGGSPILTYRPVFYNWSTTFEICYTTDIYSDEQILAFINQSGFSNGIGSNRPGTSGTNGMYHIVAN